MKIARFIKFFMLSLVVCSCATAKHPVAYRNMDPASLVIVSLADRSAQIILPASESRADENQVLERLKSMAARKTAVVILEDYAEPQLGTQFRDRSLGWFIRLRQLGYGHIVFLQGKGVGQPDGLPVLAEYD